MADERAHVQGDARRSTTCPGRCSRRAVGSSGPGRCRLAARTAGRPRPAARAARAGAADRRVRRRRSAPAACRWRRCASPGRTPMSSPGRPCWRPRPARCRTGRGRRSAAPCCGSASPARRSCRRGSASGPARRRPPRRRWSAGWSPPASPWPGTARRPGPRRRSDPSSNRSGFLVAAVRRRRGRRRPAARRPGRTAVSWSGRAESCPRSASARQLHGVHLRQVQPAEGGARRHDGRQEDLAPPAGRRVVRRPRSRSAPPTPARRTRRRRRARAGPAARTARALPGTAARRCATGRAVSLSWSALGMYRTDLASGTTS